MEQYHWSRTEGYPVHSKGDKRFSAFYAILPDGRSIELTYQNRKGYPGNDFRLGKGKPPVDTTMDTWGVYLGLWWLWASNNKPLIEELRIKVRSTNNTLCDIFASTPVNQAHALSIILYQTQEGVF